MRQRVPVVLAAAVPLAVLAVFFVLPVAGMLSRGFVTDGRLALGPVLEVLSRPRTGRVLWFTLWSAGLATVVAVVVGVPVAHALYRLDFHGRGVLRAVVVVPFVLPTVVVGVAFRQLLGEAGPLAALRLDGTATAIVLALVFFNVSVVVRTVGTFWEGLGVRQEQAAAALGASPWQVWRTVTVPALLPGVVAAASVVFLFCSTAFGVVLTLGGLRYANVETEIYLLTTQELDLPAAAALSVLQVLVVVGLLLLAARTRRQPVAQARGATASHRPRRRTADVLVLVWTAMVVTALLAPLVSLVEASLHEGPRWSLGNYRALATTGGRNALLVPVTEALRNSLVTAAVAATMALVLGTTVAVLVSRPGGRAGARRGRELLDGVFMLPLGVSAVTLGFGFLITLDRPPLALRDSALLVPLAQAMVALPLVVRAVAPVLRSVDPRLREAARCLGAGPVLVLATVDLPLAWRSLLAAAGFAFAVSLGEFGATSFLSRQEHPTLPVVIYRLIGRPGAENYGMAMAASVVLAATTALVVLLVERLRVDVGGVGVR